MLAAWICPPKAPTHVQNSHKGLSQVALSVSGRGSWLVMLRLQVPVIYSTVYTTYEERMHRSGFAKNEVAAVKPAGTARQYRMAKNNQFQIHSIKPEKALEVCAGNKREQDGNKLEWPLVSTVQNCTKQQNQRRKSVLDLLQVAADAISPT